MTLARDLCLVALLALTSCDSPSDPDDDIEPVTDPAVPTRVVATLSDSSAVVGQNIKAVATAFNYRGEVIPDVTWWNETDRSIIHVDPDGWGTALAPGEVYVIATAGDVADSVLLTVEPDTVVAVRIREFVPGLNDLLKKREPPYPVIGGIGKQLEAVSVYSAGTVTPYEGPMQWTSSDPSVATVDSTGFVSALSMGSAVIRLSVPGFDSDSAAVFTIPGYDVQQLGFEAMAMNEVGQIVGADSTGAVLWDDGALTRLGDWTPIDINDAGVIVGHRGLAPNRQPVVWRDGVLSDLPAAGHADVVPSAINADGTIAGTFLQTGGISNGYAVRWIDGVLDTLAAGAAAWGIDDDGNIVGAQAGAVQWNAAGAMTVIDADPRTAAYDRNADGWVVGGDNNSDGKFAFVDPVAWSPDGERLAFADPFARARFTAINDDGVMVGYGGSSVNVSQNWPFVAYPDGRIVVLHAFVPDGEFDPQYARDIDDAGRIIVGERLLTPVPF